MVYAHEYLPRAPHRRAFDIPSIRPAGGAAKRANEENAEARMAECEFGPVGRDPRYPSGWFIMPAFVLGAGILGFLL